MTPAGLEPAIPGSVGRCLTHWATGPTENPTNLKQHFVDEIDPIMVHFFHASGLPAELFFCVPQLVLSRDICLEALGQSAPGTPTKAGPVLLCRHPLRNAWSGCVILCQAAPVGKLLWHNTAMTPAGLEPAIPGSVGRCLIQWATGPSEKLANLIQSVSHWTNPS